MTLNPPRKPPESARAPTPPTCRGIAETETEAGKRALSQVAAGAIATENLDGSRVFAMSCSLAAAQSSTAKGVRLASALLLGPLLLLAACPPSESTTAATTSGAMTTTETSETVASSTFESTSSTTTTTSTTTTSTTTTSTTEPVDPLCPPEEGVRAECKTTASVAEACTVSGIDQSQTELVLQFNKCTSSPQIEIALKLSPTQPIDLEVGDEALVAIDAWQDIDWGPSGGFSIRRADDNALLLAGMSLHYMPRRSPTSSSPSSSRASPTSAASGATSASPRQSRRES